MPTLNAGWLEFQLINLGYAANFPLLLLLHNVCSALLFRAPGSQHKTRRCVTEWQMQYHSALLACHCLLLALLMSSKVPAGAGPSLSAEMAFWGVESECCHFSWSWGGCRLWQNCSYRFPASHPFILLALIKSKCWPDTEPDPYSFTKGKLRHKLHSV